MPAGDAARRAAAGEGGDCARGNNDGADEVIAAVGDVDDARAKGDAIGKEEGRSATQPIGAARIRARAAAAGEP